MKKFAFTLAEVLIVLAVLGVVAAITVPSLIQDAQEKALITALKRSYSNFSQAVDMAVVENGAPNTWDIGDRNTKDGSVKLYNILKPYLKIEKECDTSRGCFASSYKALFKSYTSYPPTYANVNVSGVLASGASFFIWSQGSGCTSGGNCGLIGVDVNGKSGPNKTGVDYFLLTLLPEGLQPYGLRYNGYFWFNCKYKNEDGNNGLGCTYWALKHENMDYLRKDGNYFGYR